MEKINVAELLKDCPKGMELDCTMFDNVSFLRIQNGTNQIIICTPDGLRFLNSYGCYHDDYSAKCVIFPKGKNTWEGFVPPCNFKDGDVITCTNSACSFVAIFKKMYTDTTFIRYVSLALDDEQLDIKDSWSDFKNPRFATEEEKEKLFNALKNKGYRWNAETKTLEKLIKPVFKIGDKISLKCEDLYWDIKTIEGDWYICTNGAKIHIEEQHHYELVLVEPRFKVGDRIKNIDSCRSSIVAEIKDDCFIIKTLDGFKHSYLTDKLSFSKQDEWELIPNKFDISSLIPFESRVLFRNTGEDIWKPAIFGCYLKDKSAPYYALGGTCWRYCIPFDANEHLLGTTDDCEDYYKTWK